MHSIDLQIRSTDHLIAFGHQTHEQDAALVRGLSVVDLLMSGGFDDPAELSRRGKS